MAQLPNQFAQTVEKGMLDLKSAPGMVLTCQVDTSQATALVPGQAVKLVDVAGGVPNVVAVAEDSEDVFGFVCYNLKDGSYPALSYVSIAFANGSIMYMQSSAAIVPGAQVSVVVVDQKVKTAVSTDRIVGFALDKAAAADALIRVVIQLKGAVL